MEQPRIIKWNWRAMFDANTLDAAQRQLHSGFLIRFTLNRAQCTASAEFKTGYRTKCGAPANYSQCANEFYIPPDAPSASAATLGLQILNCSCSDSQSAPCAHEAALLLDWEKQRGSFTFRETTEERNLREKKEQERQPQPVMEAVLFKPAATPAMTTAGRMVKIPAAAPADPRIPIKDFFPDLQLPSHIYFNLPKMLEDNTTTKPELQHATRMDMRDPLVTIAPSLVFTTTGEQALSCKLSVDGEAVRFTLARDRIVRYGCTKCRVTFNEKNSLRRPAFCVHLLLGFRQVIDHICRYRPGDATDQDADQLMRTLAHNLEQPRDDRRKPIISMIPAVIFLAGKPVLTAMVRQGLAEYHQCASLRSIVDAHQGRAPMYFAHGHAVDFEHYTFTEDSLPFLHTIESIYELYTRSSRQDHFLKYEITVQPILVGPVLDRFYELTENTTVPIVSDGTPSSQGRIQIGPEEGLFRLNLSLSEKDDQNVLLLEGVIPQVLYGESAIYLCSLNHRALQRVDRESEKIFGFFLDHADAQGAFSCTIGENRLMYFCHRILPLIRSCPVIRLRDLTPEGFISTVPVEAIFTFYLSAFENQYACRIEVTYGEISYAIPYSDDTPIMRDIVLETEVSDMVQRFFPELDNQSGLFLCEPKDDSLYAILHNAVPELERYGQVMASDDFPSLRMRKVGDLHFEVSIQSDLLAVSLLSDNLTEEELLELLKAFRKKEHYHRLRSGDFIDIESAEMELERLISMAELMDLSPEEIIQRTAHMPRSRAAFVRAMMHTHTGLLRSRDEHFQKLVDDFEHIRDTQFEVPESLKDIMRPYQVTGFNWLSTLTEAGFGGILADDMGLGKTLQMLSLFLSLHEKGEKEPFLIVCPASLVYNWAEECKRFTPSLSCVTLTGSAASREKTLTELKNGTRRSDLYVASYDVVRRDIILLQAIPFAVVTLDEAQYIKTTRANITKAVKILQAKHRFALTGTPIENRLSELWSIFDFLMPGFLFSQEKFRNTFDSPITVSQDPEMIELLAHMTAPFILRRLKTDVLKELPEKLEEVRTAVFGEEQARLYDAQVVKVRQLVMSAHKNEERFQVLAELLHMRMLCCDPSLVLDNYQGESAKRTACLDLIESAIDGGHRILLFSQFTSMLALLAKDLDEANISYYTLTGATPKEERIRLVHDFNTGETPVFLISLKAGGTGLNLVGADVVIHYDPWWNLAAQNQATDRAHRIGQTRQVTVYKLIAQGTIEERIVQLQEAKKDLADAILEGRSESLLSMSRDELLTLIGGA